MKMNITAKELGLAIEVSDKNARGLIMFLEETGCVTHIGSRKNSVAKVGKPANDYSIDFESCKTTLNSLIECLRGIASKEQQTVQETVTAVNEQIAAPITVVETMTEDEEINELETLDSFDDMPSIDELPDYGEDPLSEFKYNSNDF